MIGGLFKTEEILFLKGYLKGLGYNNAIKAITIAENYHSGAKRKSSEPYISHPIRIANALISLGLTDEKIIIATILHDVLEDTDMTEFELLTIFDKEVVDIIKLLTKDKNYNNDDYYKAIGKNKYASIVKIADRCHNVSTMYFFNEDKIKKYIEETEKYILPLCSLVCNNFPEVSNEIYYMKYHLESILETSKFFLNRGFK